ncbi:uncharacterized protein RJT20DRAFT_2884 [Scheffersomyces xylosifermentans]|uniref:uncharacterized protein n=1 Tax=Scheffersomyces xylosifermentans TaxID=1304137 RepID=UPI00315CB99A
MSSNDTDIKSATTEAVEGTRSTIVPPNNNAPVPSANGATLAITNTVTAKTTAKNIAFGVSTPIINSPENTVSPKLLTKGSQFVPHQLSLPTLSTVPSISLTKAPEIVAITTALGNSAALLLGGFGAWFFAVVAFII